MATKPNPAQTRLQERQYEVTVPCVADRIAQTVVAARPEKAVEPVFHPGSYRYRPGKSQLDAVAACRKRCWRKDWLTDLDAEKFFDSVRGDLIIKAVAAHTDLPWVVLYVRRWLAVPLQLPDGSLLERDRGTPQGSSVSPAPGYPTLVLAQGRGVPVQRRALQQDAAGGHRGIARHCQGRAPPRRRRPAASRAAGPAASRCRPGAVLDVLGLPASKNRAPSRQVVELRL
jgi:hypothetical protein